MFLFLTVVQALVAALLVGVILVQKSEGGGLGVGGSPSGLMSARGAANFLTRATSVLATLFVVLSIALAAIGVGATSNRSIDTTLDRRVTPGQGTTPQQDLLGANVVQPASSAPASEAAPAGNPDPLQNAAQ